MDGRLVSPKDFDRVTRSPYPFTDQERAEGVHIPRNNVSTRFWDLLTSYGSGVLDCYTGSAPGAHQDVACEVALACEREVVLHSIHTSLMDRVQYVDRARDGGDMVEGVRRCELLKQATRVAEQWRNTVMRMQKLQVNYDACQDSRLHRLHEALDMMSVVRELCESAPDGVWTPSDAFVAAIRSEIKELRGGVKMTEYWRLQNAFSHLTLRPLFSPRELELHGGLWTEADPYHSIGIEGTLEERFALATLAIQTV